MSKVNDFLAEQTILLGGKVSHKFPDFETISRLTPSWAELLFFISNMERWEKETDEVTVMKEIVDYLGMANFVTVCDEITRLSMIVGDDRQRLSLKGLRDELGKLGSDTAT